MYVWHIFYMAVTKCKLLAVGLRCFIFKGKINQNFTWF